MERVERVYRRWFSREHGVRGHLVGRWLFLRALGLIYFSVFFALLFQVKGLVGTHGILPAREYLQALSGQGALRFWYAPTLLWLSASNHMLMALVWVGLVASLLVVANVAPRAMLVVCFVCFLSFVGAAQDFAAYQSDGMLLEAGFLSLFLAPRGWWPGWGAKSDAHPLALAPRAAWFLLLWEWFRIYFESGVVKLASGDKTWRNLTAMYDYYQNGPLPTWIGWYLQHLPHWFQKATAGATLGMELVLVWMVFLGRRARIACFFLVTAWQIVVIATANYAFLNYLVLVLAFLLLDDGFLWRFVPARWRVGDMRHPAANGRPIFADTWNSAGCETAGLSTAAQERAFGRDDRVVADDDRVVADDDRVVAGEEMEEGARIEGGEARADVRPSGLSRVQTAVAAVVLTWIAYATTVPLVEMFWPTAPLPSQPVAILDPFRIANTYGLFAVMTPDRYEIEFQGSDDGVKWTAYPFRYKPQNVAAAPGIYAPYQPRFDWNLWFASLGTWQQNTWVVRTEELLLQNDKDVLSLFAGNPFGSAAPKYVRAVLWQYWFSTREQKRTEGVWWTRTLLGAYAPPVERLPDGKFAAVE
jgi:hypothetical protein